MWSRPASSLLLLAGGGGWRASRRCLLAGRLPSAYSFSSSNVHPPPSSPPPAIKPLTAATPPPLSSSSFSVFKNDNASRTKLANYRFTREIGRGTFACVREAMVEDTSSSSSRPRRRAVAVKVMNKQRCGQPMCENEVRVLGELNRRVQHQRFTPVLDVFEDDENLYIVFELLRGGELFDLVLERGQLSEAEVAQICRKLLYALRTLHMNRIIHRDIKLENIMLIGAGGAGDSATDFKLIDFGLALEEEEESAEPASAATAAAPAPFVGTLGYCAPELLSADTRHYTTASDVWSVGVVCYILLSGAPPFAVEDEEEDEGAPLEQRVANELKAIRAAREPAEWRRTMNSPPWNLISKETKLCVSKMLDMDPVRRSRIDEILKDDFITRFTQASDGEFGEFE